MAEKLGNLDKATQLAEVEFTQFKLMEPGSGTHVFTTWHRESVVTAHSLDISA